MSAVAPGWNAERKETAIALWGKGWSASEIAYEIGGMLSRNAVIGFVHRQGLARGVKPSVPKGAARPRAAKFEFRAAQAPIQKKQRIHPGNIVRKRNSRRHDPALVEAALTPPADLNVKLLDLGSRMCRWPIGDPQNADFHFCGAETSDFGISYCPWHRKLSYRAQPARTGRPVVVGHLPVKVPA